jgi:hypothetical protein
MATEPNPLHLNDGTPTVTLGGVLWPVPKLAIRQLRRLQGKLDPIVDVIFRPPAKGFDDLTPEQFDDLAFVIFVALTRAHPTITLEEFEAMPMDWREMWQALAVVWDQAIAPRREQSPGEATRGPSPSITTVS